MATISKSGITNGGTIDASHITRIIEALDGTGSADIYATGSFTGSFKGDGSGITGITITSASYASTASYLTGAIESASFASTASFVNRLAQNVVVTGSLTLSGSASTSLTVQKRAVFNDITTFNSNAIISGMQYYDLVTQTTTDATRTDVWTYEMANGRANTVEVTIIGVSSSLSDTESVGGNLVGVARCESGVASIVGASSSSFDSAGFTYTYASYGLGRVGVSNTIAVWVRGLANTTIDWKVAVRQL